MKKNCYTLLVIDDDPGDVELLRRYINRIEEWDIKIIECNSAQEALNCLKNETPDIVFIDYMLGANTGLDAYHEINQVYSDLHFVMLTGQGNEVIAVDSLKAGVHDYLVKGSLSTESLRKTINHILNMVQMEQKIIEQQKHLEALATKDSLTGLYNRRYFMERMKEEMDKSFRHSIPLSLIMIDIDHFKLVNDTYGHLMGDDVLTKIGSIINTNVRSSDIAGRYGGEELSILLFNSKEEQAKILADRIRLQIADITFRSDKGESFHVTSSFGIAETKDEAGGSRNLFARADECLYQAKSEGRNRVVISSQTLQNAEKYVNKV